VFTGSRPEKGSSNTHSSGSDKSVAVYIRRIRQKIERDPDAPEILLTVRGFGYRLSTGS